MTAGRDAGSGGELSGSSVAVSSSDVSSFFMLHADTLTHCSTSSQNQSSATFICWLKVLKNRLKMGEMENVLLLKILEG